MNEKGFPPPSPKCLKWPNGANIFFFIKVYFYISFNKTDNLCVCLSFVYIVVYEECEVKKSKGPVVIFRRQGRVEDFGWVTI